MNGAPLTVETARRSLQALERRISQACVAAGRAKDSVSLLAVSKTFPASDVLAFAAAGQTEFGENYLQEALDKQAQCRAAAADIRLHWHFIGPIQSNKTRAIASNFDWVHSIDRARIAQRLNDHRPAQMPALNVCIQVNVDGEASKRGCTPDELPELLRIVRLMPRLRLRGLMAIPAPVSADNSPLASFAMMRALLARSNSIDYPLDTLSMGMSADLEQAIAQGASMVRIGTALFGSRSHA